MRTYVVSTGNKYQYIFVIIFKNPRGKESPSPPLPLSLYFSSIHNKEVSSLVCNVALGVVRHTKKKFRSGTTAIIHSSLEKKARLCIRNTKKVL